MKCKNKRCKDKRYKRDYCLDHYINDQIKKQDYADSLKRVSSNPDNHSTAQKRTATALSKVDRTKQRVWNTTPRTAKPPKFNLDQWKEKFK